MGAGVGPAMGAGVGPVDRGTVLFVACLCMACVLFLSGNYTSYSYSIIVVCCSCTIGDDSESFHS